MSVANSYKRKSNQSTEASLSASALVLNQETRNTYDLRFEGDYVYRIMRDGNAEFVSFVGDPERFTVPPYLGGRPVSSFSYEWDCSSLGRIRHLIIPADAAGLAFLRVYGKYLFNLEEFSVAETHSCLSAQDGILFSKDNSELISCPMQYESANYCVPYGTRVICQHAFTKCQALQAIILPEGLKTIAEYSFDSCPQLQRIILPETLTTIGECAFYCCRSLDEVNIPAGVVNIGVQSFLSFDSSLRAIHVSSENPVYRDLEGVLFTRDLAKLICYPGGKSESRYAVPEATRCIGSNAFSGCNYLQYVHLPQTLNKLESGAFQYSSIIEIQIPGSIHMIPKDAFASCYSLQRVILDEGVRTICSFAFDNCMSGLKIQMPYSVEQIANLSLSSNTNLIADVLPSSFAESHCRRHHIPFHVNEARANRELTISAMAELEDESRMPAPKGHPVLKRIAIFLLVYDLFLLFHRLIR